MTDFTDNDSTARTQVSAEVGEGSREAEFRVYQRPVRVHPQMLCCSGS
jgi:hypothetical protein